MTSHLNAGSGSGASGRRSRVGSLRKSRAPSAGPRPDARSPAADGGDATATRAQPTSALKILIVGAIGVGKTALAQRLARGVFEPSYRTTVGVDVIRCELEAPSGAPTGLILWDTDGDFGHSIFASPYLAGVAGVMAVADATRPRTLVQMASLLEAFERADPARPTCAVLTKCDLVQMPPRPIPALRGRRLFQVSAATGDGVFQAFDSLARESGRTAPRAIARSA